MTHKYHKISNIYIRDIENQNRLCEGAFNKPAFEYLKDNEWEFTEKIDGTNIRVCWDGYKVTFQGRTDKAIIPKELLTRLEELFGTPEAEEIFEQSFGTTEVTLYGEGYGGKIQSGKKYRENEDFILFDVMFGDDSYANREYVENVAKMFNIDCVPVVLKGTLQEGVDFVKTHPESTIGNCIMEGVVGRPSIELSHRNERVIVKIKCRDFK